MRRGSSVVGSVVLALAVLLPSAARAADPPQLRLLRDVQVSQYTRTTPNDCPPGEHSGDCYQRDTEVEPSIAVNPEDSRNAVAVFQSGRRDDGGAAFNGYAVTFDGGATWENGVLPGITRFQGGKYQRASDPVVAFGPGGIAYANSLTIGPMGLVVNVSRDGGRTWSDPKVIIDSALDVATDKNWITVDTGTGPGHHPGRIYVVWDRIAPVLAAYSDDEGETWHLGPTGRGYVVYPGQGIGAIPLVLPGGDLGIVFETAVSVVPPVREEPGEIITAPEAGVTKFLFARAPGAGTVPTGGPLVFAPPTTIGTYLGNDVEQQRAGEGLPAAAVDRESGRIYVAWDDARFAGDFGNDIVVARSSDGVRWSRPVQVTSGPDDKSFEYWCPMLDVSTEGMLRVGYRMRDWANRDEQWRVHTFVQESTDGVSFSDPLKVNVPESDLRFAAQSRGGAFLGDYHQLAIGEDLTYVVHTEPLDVNPGEPKTFPPTYHHQRAWVAVLDEDAEVESASDERELADTGLPAPDALGAVMVVMAVAFARRARRARSA